MHVRTIALRVPSLLASGTYLQEPGDVSGVVNALEPNTLRAWRQLYIVLSSETAMRSFTRVTACSRFPDTNKRIACGKRIQPASKLKQTADRTFISKRNLISSAPQSRKQRSKVSNARSFSPWPTRATAFEM